MSLSAAYHSPVDDDCFSTTASRRPPRPVTPLACLRHAALRAAIEASSSEESSDREGVLVLGGLLERGFEDGDFGGLGFEELSLGDLGESSLGDFGESSLGDLGDASLCDDVFGEADFGESVFVDDFEDDDFEDEVFEDECLDEEDLECEDLDGEAGIVGDGGAFDSFDDFEDACLVGVLGALGSSRGTLSCANAPGSGAAGTNFVFTIFGGATTGGAGGGGSGS